MNDATATLTQYLWRAAMETEAWNYTHADRFVQWEYVEEALLSLRRGVALSAKGDDVGAEEQMRRWEELSARIPEEILEGLT